VAEHYPKLIKELQRCGHELACHGYNHRLVYNLSHNEFREDTRRTKKIIEDITGEPVIGYRSPSYSITKNSLWALDILIEEDFKYDSSIFPIYHDIYGYPEFNRFSVKVSNNGGDSILEIPLSTVRFFGKNIPIAGGGYLRFAPVRLVERAINLLNNKEVQPAIIYFHPWEVDPEQPKLNGGRISSFRHYTNIAKTIPKLRHLLDNFQFGPIKQVFADKLTIAASCQ
jgi:polysaccharide deacetylase family protein (PEP-CTERM system associated)